MKYLEIKSEKLLEQAKSMTPDKIKSIRALYNLTQVGFADVLNVSYHTYRNWEIGHRRPGTSTVALLMIAEKNPKIFLKKRLHFIKTITKLFKDLSL